MSRLQHPGKHMWRDGLSTLNFSLAGPPRHIDCAGHTLHIIDTLLARPESASAHATACVADGSARDDGCSARVDLVDVPADLLSAAKRALPRESRVLGVAGVTRGRVMYNYHYELDLNVEEKHGRRTLQRIAVCSQEWHGQGAPEHLRFHLLWRAVARRNGARANRTATTKGFRLQKDFQYTGHFPCSLSAPPSLEGRTSTRARPSSGPLASASGARGAAEKPKSSGSRRSRLIMF